MPRNRSTIAYIASTWPGWVISWVNLENGFKDEIFHVCCLLVALGRGRAGNPYNFFIRYTPECLTEKRGLAGVGLGLLLGAASPPAFPLVRWANPADKSDPCGQGKGEKADGNNDQPDPYPQQAVSQ